MNALPIARLFGFEIRVHVSWAIILAVIGVTAATQVAVIAPGIGAAGGWVIGAVVAAAFLLSALAHELGSRPRGAPRRAGRAARSSCTSSAGPPHPVSRPPDPATRSSWRLPGRWSA